MEEKKEKKEAPKEQTLAEKQLEFDKLSKDYNLVKGYADEYFNKANEYTQKANVFDTFNAAMIIPRLNKLKQEIDEANNLKERVEKNG